MQNMIMDVKDNVGRQGKTSIHPDVYSITHDLRAPLMSIKGLINLLRSDLTKEHFDAYLMFLEASVDKMNDSISEIIDHSKNNRDTEIPKQEIDFYEIIKESLQSFKYMEDMESVHITISTEESGLFISDRKRILSFFNNMISNAIRYRDSSKNSYLHIDISFNKGNAIITFKDNGIGIAEEFQSKIFNKLFRVTNDNRGSGIGLHIVQKSIKTLGGKIKLQSILGEGSTFTIEIPNLLSSNLSVHCD
ncbi:MAG TPA: HAMP domain-containing sensor histidine kinase [Chryseolinea sp.]|nr:HAMP domain-containing sensor histidine kinase [Chryseolinea sp.]HPM31016.1 HAMP domain-containing sensor histidine kinase [Chryseolinea sp.]